MINKTILKAIFNKYDNCTLYSSKQERNVEVFKEIINKINGLTYTERAETYLTQLNVVASSGAQSKKPTTVTIYRAKSGVSKISIGGPANNLEKLFKSIKGVYLKHLNPPLQYSITLEEFEALFD